jgi:hypothetical protein
MTGPVIPEAVTSETEYRTTILAPMYRDIAPFDPAGAMQDEWLNSRAAIARFDRSAIEIRVIDTQECPRADLAVAAATVAVVRARYDDAAGEMAEPLDSARLLAILQACARDADGAIIDDAGYLARLGYPGRRCSARELWAELLEASLFREPGAARPWQQPLELILTRGTLARRVLDAVGPEVDAARLHAVYRQLCDCLATGELFHGLD